MSNRDCENCKHHTEKGCDSWDCEFERRMARKEIIEMLNVLKEQALKSHNDTAIIDVKKDSFIYVMDATINSLKMEQIEPCEDAISRQAVEDAIAETIVNGESLGYAIAQEIVSDLPPVKPQEPKTGHWIKYSPFAKPYCSECENSCFGVHGFNYTISPYCPNCGAKMTESEDKE